MNGKKIFALSLLVVVLVMGTGAALAAQWPEGRSASQPYSGVPSVDLTRSWGYQIFLPQAKMPAEYFCDTLTLYVPREDVLLGTGSLRLFDEEGQVLSVDFADGRSVSLRAMSDGELEGLMWGSGTACEIHLPISLRFHTAYSVEMDQGCLSVRRSRVVSTPVHKGQWAPVLTGDYGVGGLYYMGREYVDENGEIGDPQLRDWPRTGDEVTFDIVLGGEAKSAMIYDPSESLSFEQMEITESTTVTGDVVKNVGDWGVIFLDEAGNVLHVVELNPVGEAAE